MEALCTKGGPCSGSLEVSVSKNSIAALNKLMMMVTFHAFGSQANRPKKLRNVTVEKEELLMMTFIDELLTMTFKAFGVMGANGPKKIKTGAKKLLMMMTLKSPYGLMEAFLCTIRNHTSIGFALQRWPKLALVDVAAENQRYTDIGDFQKEHSLAFNSWFLLPEDLVIDEILSRLPVKSLMRFKSVSKRWCALPTNHSFIALHLKNINTPNRLVSWNGNDSGLIIGHDAFHVFTEGGWTCDVQPVNLDFGFDTKPDFVLGPCDGIFCLYWRPHLHLKSQSPLPIIALWNPSTREFSTLPMSNFDFPPYKRFEGCLVGFGFDLTTKGIKVVKVVSFYKGGPNGEPPRRYPKKRGDPPRKFFINCAEVYDLDSGSWRVLHVDDIVQEAHVPDEDGTVCLYNTNDGVFHWQARNNLCGDRKIFHCKKFVLSFDMSRELFHVTLLPEDITSRWISCNLNSDCRFGILRDSLAVIFYLFEEGHTAVEVWVMRKDLDRMVEEAGESFSLYTLSRELTVEPPPPLPFRCLLMGFWNKNELLIWKNVSHFGQTPISRATPVLYDIVAKQARDVQFSGEWNFLYRESLVSVKGGAEMCKSV